MELLTSTAVITVLFALIFKILPDAKIEWRNVWVGAVTSAILFDIGKYALTFYFKFASTNSTYGAAGSLAALLIWVYYSAQLVFLRRNLRRSMPPQPAIAFFPTPMQSPAPNRNVLPLAFRTMPCSMRRPEGSGRGFSPMRPNPATQEMRRYGSPVRAGAVAGFAGLVAGAAIAYLGREAFSRGVQRLYLRKAEQVAARKLTQRIDRLQALVRRAQSVRIEDVNRRIEALSERLTKTARRTVPPADRKDRPLDYRGGSSAKPQAAGKREV